MKHTKKIYFILILLILNSCQNEELITENTVLDTDLKENTDTRSATRDTSEELETQLHWVSFLIAKAIHESADAEQVFIDAFYTTGTGSSNVVSLNTLLNVPFDNKFETAFEAAFYYYYYPNSDCPSTLNPRGGPKPPGAIGGFDDCTEPINRCLEANYQLYLDYLTKDNCLEIFLPAGYDSSQEQIYTTVHPLTNFGANEGYTMPEDCNNDISISPFNLHLLNNIIVTRPFRNLDSRCEYIEFEHVEDFTLFLNN